jgi:predicted alpha/beta superfamily hydrolase
VSPSFKLRSPETGTEYWIYLELPPVPATRRPAKAQPWGAMVFLDGDNQFPAAVRAWRSIRRAGGKTKAKRGKMPPLLLVGVGYGASYGKAANKRGRDYTPTAHAFEPSSGGARAFLKFLTHTLWPELERRYPLDPARRGLGGYSLSALFVLYALFQKAPFFTHHLAASPSVWWADRSILAQARRLRSRQRNLPARLFLSVGEKDSPSMTGDLALLEAQLAQKPFAKLRIFSRRFPRRTHFTALPVSFRTGLKDLFASDLPDDPKRFSRKEGTPSMGTRPPGRVRRPGGRRSKRVNALSLTRRKRCVRHTGEASTSRATRPPLRVLRGFA